MQAESGGPHGAPIDALETFRRSAVPQTEFWSQNAHRSKDEERFFTKEAASAANIYGRKFVAQEGETSVGPQWSESLATDLKPAFDQQGVILSEMKVRIAKLLHLELMQQIDTPMAVLIGKCDAWIHLLGPDL